MIHAPWVETMSYDPCGMVSYGCHTAHGHWTFVTSYTPSPMGKKSLNGVAKLPGMLRGYPVTGLERASINEQAHLEPVLVSFDGI